MLKDIGQIYQEVGAACAAVTQGPIRLSDEFIAAYTQFIVAQQHVRGGFKSVSFDANGARLQKGGSGVSITTVTNYSFAIAHVLCPLLKALKEYKSIFDQIYADQTVEKRIKISDLLRKGDAVAIADLDVRTSELTQDEQSKMKRFLTDYDWWHGGKAFGRPNDYFNSPLLACAKLVAANNGAIPTIVTHFCEDQTLFNSFAYSDALAGGGNEKHLDVALRMFTINRVKTEWCADNTDGDTTKPQTGYVANAKLRAAMPMTNNLGTDVQVVQWFKDYAYPDGKSWLDGVDTNGCAAFGGYINYLVAGGAVVARPAKFTRSLESAVKAIVKSASECFYNKDIHAVLKYLGLIGFDFKEDFDEDDYQDALHAQRVIKRRLKDMGEKQIVEWDAAANQAKPNDKEPDFLTVNEFLWFVKEHFKEINEEVTKMSVTPVQHQAYDKTKTKKKTFNADSKEDQLMLRILASLRTKPFVILAGHSGTGKSRMVKKLAYMTCRDNKLHEGSDPGNYCIIEVKPNWHDSTELLGYFSSFGHDHYVTKQLVEFIMKAYAYPDVPFFVCLDEMNLAPVEQYFAEFLSALEDIHMDEGKMNEFFGLNDANKPDGSAAQEVVKYTSAPLIKPIDYKDDIAMLEPKTTQAMDWLKTHGLTIPKNLFVVGTVNMDESTNQFSRKVLDRAFTIEMTDARFEDFGDTDKDPLPTFAKEDEIDHALIDNLLMGEKQAGKLSTRGADTAQPKGQLENMNDLKGVLAGTPFVVAYRFANEYALYEDALNALDMPADGASDEAKAAKKVANAKRAFDDAVLMKLLPRIAGERAVVAEIFEGRKATDKRGEKDGLLKFLEYDKEQKKGTASGEKMTEILNRGNVPYLTFWP